MIRLLLLLSLALLSVASDKTERQIVEKVIAAMSEVSPIPADSPDGNFHELIDKSEQLTRASNPLFQLANDICGNPKVPLFTMKYRLFKRCDNAVAAFFWMKGRPNIIYLKPRLEQFNLKVDPMMESYIEEEL